MAGSFGYEQGHYEVSQACGERVLFPAVRGTAADDLVFAPGFSCRHQIADFCDNRRGLHTAELLAIDEVMMRRAIWFAALVAFGCASPARSTVERARQAADAELRLPHDVVGCYALYGEGGRRASQTLYFASDRVHLDSAAWIRPGTWKATRLGGDGGMPADGRQGNVYWAADSLAADTVHVMIHTGFSGSELILGVPAAPSDTLRGRALEHWDMGPSTNEAGRATAIRVPCAHDG